MDRISYDYYRIFCYMAKYGSFSLAAEILNSNQPNITKFINNLEGQLRCRLLFRSNKGVSLTAEGERLFFHVSVAYAELRETEEELSGTDRMQAGTAPHRCNRNGTARCAFGSSGRIPESLSRYRGLYITNSTTSEAIASLQKVR